MSLNKVWLIASLLIASSGLYASSSDVPDTVHLQDSKCNFCQKTIPTIHSNNDTQTTPESSCPACHQTLTSEQLQLACALRLLQLNNLPTDKKSLLKLAQQPSARSIDLRQNTLTELRTKFMELSKAIYGGFYAGMIPGYQLHMNDKNDTALLSNPIFMLSAVFAWEFISSYLQDKALSSVTKKYFLSPTHATHMMGILFGFIYVYYLTL